MRIVASACALSLGLLIGSGAIAAADSGDTGTGAGSGGAGTSGTGTTGTKTSAALSSSDTDTTTGSAGSGSTGSTTSPTTTGSSGEDDDSAATPPIVVATPTVTAAGAVPTAKVSKPFVRFKAQTVVIKRHLPKTGGAASDVAASGAPEPEPGVAATADPAGGTEGGADASVPADTTPAPAATAGAGSDGVATTEPLAGGTAPAVSDPGAGSGSGGDAVVAAPAAAPSATQPADTVPAVRAVTPITAALVTMAQAVGKFPADLASVPYSQTPVIDVITAVQDLLGSLTGAVVTLSGDIYTLVGAQAPVHGPLVGVAGGLRAPTVPDGVTLIGLPVPPTVGTSALPDIGPLFGPVVADPAVAPAGGKPAAPQPLRVSGLAPLPQGVQPSSVKSLLDHVIDAMLAPASLTALAAIAIPGVLGLLLVSGAGVRVGYRQAKAGAVLRVSGIARFAGSGPLGVVRSGTLIALHSRSVRAERRRHAAPECTVVDDIVVDDIVVGDTGIERAA